MLLSCSVLDCFTAIDKKHGQWVTARIVTHLACLLLGVYARFVLVCLPRCRWTGWPSSSGICLCTSVGMIVCESVCISGHDVSSYFVPCLVFLSNICVWKKKLFVSEWGCRSRSKLWRTVRVSLVCASMCIIHVLTCPCWCCRRSPAPVSNRDPYGNASLSSSSNSGSCKGSDCSPTSRWGIPIGVWVCVWIGECGNKKAVWPTCNPFTYVTGVHR